MQTEFEFPGTHGTPLAMQDADGNWVEIGYVTDLVFAVREDYRLMAGEPWRVQRDYQISLDAQANDQAYAFLHKLREENS